MARAPEGKAGQRKASRQGCSMSHVPEAETGKMYLGNDETYKLQWRVLKEEESER